MKLSVAALCDRATVREGLLHILGAGITNITTRLPSGIPLDLAVMFALDKGDSGKHDLTVVVAHEDTEDIVGEIRAQFDIPAEALQTTDLPLPAAAAAIPLGAIKVSKAGFYVVTMTVEGLDVTKFRLRISGQGDEAP